MARPVKKRKPELKREQLKRLYHYKKSIGQPVTIKALAKKYHGRRVTGAAYRVHDKKGHFLSEQKSRAVEYIIKDKRKKGQTVDLPEIVERAKTEKILVSIPGTGRPFHTELAKIGRDLVEQNPNIIFSIKKDGRTKKYDMSKKEQADKAWEVINDNMNDVYRVYNDVKVDVESFSPLFQVPAEEQYYLGDKKKKIVYYTMDFDKVIHDIKGTKNLDLYNEYKSKSRFRR